MVLVSNLESFLLLWGLSVNTTVQGCRNKDSHPLVRHTGWQGNAAKLNHTYQNATEFHTRLC